MSQASTSFVSEATVAISVDGEGTVRFASPGCLHILGWAPEALVGVSLAETLIPAEDRVGFTKKLRAKRTDCMVQEAKHHEGHRVLLLWRWRFARPEEDGDGLAHGVALDIAGRPLMEKWAGDLVHDLKNPLNAVGLQLSLLSRRLGKEPDEKIRAPIEVMRRELAKANDILQAFFAAARSTDDGVKPRRPG